MSAADLSDVKIKTTVGATNSTLETVKTEATAGATNSETVTTKVKQEKSFADTLKIKTEEAASSASGSSVKYNIKKVFNTNRISVVWFSFGDEYTLKHLSMIEHTIQHHTKLFGNYFDFKNINKSIDYFIVYFRLGVESGTKLKECARRYNVKCVHLYNFFDKIVNEDLKTEQFYRNFKHSVLCKILTLTPSLVYMDLDVKYTASVEDLVEQRCHMFLVDKISGRISKDSTMKNIFLLMQEFGSPNTDEVYNSDIIPCTLISIGDQYLVKKHYEHIHDINWNLYIDWSHRVNFYNTVNGYVVFWDVMNSKSIPMQIDREINFKHLVDSYLQFT